MFTSTNVAFKSCTEEQEVSLRNWTRNTWSYSMLIDPNWHPVILDEIANILKATARKRGEFSNGNGNAPH